MLVSIVLLTGCSSTSQIDALDKEQLARFLLHLNNDSQSERWRNGLIEMGKRSSAARDQVLGELKQAYDRSLSWGGNGFGILRPPGRYRVMEIVGALGRTPEGRALLERGVEEGDRVGQVAAASLSSWGDSATAPTVTDEEGHEVVALEASARR